MMDNLKILWELFVVIGWYASGLVGAALAYKVWGTGAAMLAFFGCYILWWIIFFLLPDWMNSRR